jgi:hypothetical protein
VKILFSATAWLVLSLSSSAQAQNTKFSDQYCGPYCANYCKNPTLCRDRIGTTPACTPNSQACHSRCLKMCHELGH